jgi:tetratricopeptide (TPR) repeat protein
VKWFGAALALASSACVTLSAGAPPPLTEREAALVELQHHNGKAVLGSLERLTAKHPEDLGLARMLCEAHVQAGSGDALLTRLAADDSARSHYMQGLVRFARAAEASGPAVAQFRRAVELAPTEPEFHYRLGVALVESEQFEQALVPLRQATALAADHPAWSLPLAKALARTGDLHGAVAALRVVVTGNATQADVKTARSLMDQIVDPFGTMPRSARPRLEQAMQWLEAGDVPQQAIVQLEELLQEFPDQAIVHSLLGLSYARLDDAGRAVDEFQRAIELAPDDGKNHLYLASLYQSRQRAKTAEEQLLKAIELNPVLDEAWFKLGDAALERQDYVTARGRFEVASRLRTDDQSAHGKLALVYQLEKNWPAADRELHVIVDKDEENLEFVLRLGVLHTERFLAARGATERAEASKEAQKWLQKVLDAQPENALASRALERLREK